LALSNKSPDGRRATKKRTVNEKGIAIGLHRLPVVQAQGAGMLPARPSSVHLHPHHNTQESDMKKLLMAGAMLVLTMTAAQAQQGFPATNIEKGCMTVQTYIVSRINQLEMNAEACRRMQASMDQGSSKEGKWFSCMNATGLMYNRNHGRLDLDRLPSDVSEGIMRGCAMMVFDVSEATYEYTRKK
jgi:hypothetical protein